MRPSQRTFLPCLAFLLAFSLSGVGGGGGEACLGVHLLDDRGFRVVLVRFGAWTRHMRGADSRAHVCGYTLPASFVFYLMLFLVLGLGFGLRRFFSCSVGGGVCVGAGGGEGGGGGGVGGGGG